MVLADPDSAARWAGGTALLVPLRHAVATPSDLLEEARLLWEAEAFLETDRIGAGWGTVGLWCRDPELARAWTETPRTVPAELASIVGEDGLMRLPRPESDLDPILVAVTVPTTSSATPREIAQAWIDGGHEHYFYETHLAGIRTVQDDEIRAALCKLERR
jgi:hypothetical protein